jgi:hypothetical protein
MRILLRNTETGAYFKNPSSWTQDPEEALNFVITGSAIEAACALSFRNVEIVKLDDAGKQVFLGRATPEKP